MPLPPICPHPLQEILYLPLESIPSGFRIFMFFCKISLTQMKNFIQTKSFIQTKNHVPKLIHNRLQKYTTCYQDTLAECKFNIKQFINCDVSHYFQCGKAPKRWQASSTVSIAADYVPTQQERQVLESLSRDPDQNLMFLKF